MTRLSIAVALALLTACPGGDDDDMQLDWQVSLSDMDGAILGFWGANRTDVFAVGGTLAEGGGEATILWHDGAAWWSMPSTAPTLWWVHGFGHDDVWAVGELGTIVHFDGSQWTTVQTGGNYTLWGIWGESAAEMWAVGGVVDGSSPSVLLRYDGADWAEVPGVGMMGEFCFRVWGSAADAVYVIGDHGALVHYDGSDWTRLDSGLDERLITIGGTGPNDIYVVGGLFDSIALHKDESGWSQIDTNTEAALMGVCAVAGQPVLVTGWRGLITVRDESGWHPQNPVTFECLHGTWCGPNGTFLAGGGNLISTGERRGVIVSVGDVATGPIMDWVAP